MSRLGTGSQALHGAASAPASRADTAIRAAAGGTVAGLAGIAGAISYSHMRGLAVAHGETGWQGHAFPLSVDGIEIVASLVLLTDRRTGHRSGWLPWAALAAGTTASLAANVAAAGADLIGRVVAGWPAFALLVAVKLLSGMLEHRHGVDRPADAQDRPHLPADGGDDLGALVDPAPNPGGGDTNDHAGMTRLADIRPVPYRVTVNGLLGTQETGTAPAADPGTEPGDVAGTSKAALAGTGTASRMGTGAGTEADNSALLAAARTARDRLLDRGDPLTRDTLAAQLRRDGHSMRNARVSQLLIALKREPLGAQAPQTDREAPKPGTEGLALDSLR
jgi:hypothetical protein